MLSNSFPIYRRRMGNVMDRETSMSRSYKRFYYLQFDERGSCYTYPGKQGKHKNEIIQDIQNSMITETRDLEFLGDNVKDTTVTIRSWESPGHVESIMLCAECAQGLFICTCRHLPFLRWKRDFPRLHHFLHLTSGTGSILDRCVEMNPSSALTPENSEFHVRLCMWGMWGMSHCSSRSVSTKSKKLVFVTSIRVCYANCYVN